MPFSLRCFSRKSQLAISCMCRFLMPDFFQRRTINVANNANFTGPRKTTVAVATLMLVKLTGCIVLGISCTACCPDSNRRQQARHILIDAFK